MLVRGQLGPSLQNRQWTEVGQREDICVATIRLDDLPHAAIRDLASHERHVLHARHAQIGDVLAVAQEKTRIFLARQACADPTV